LKDHWTVFHNDEKWAPLSFRGYFTIGAEYMNMRFPDKANEYYDKAQTTGAWDGNLLGNIIGYYIVKGDHRAALSFYEQMEQKKEYVAPTGTLNIAVLYMLDGNCGKAVRLATSFGPLKNHSGRIETVKKCETYKFEEYDLNNIQDVYSKQQLMKELGLEIERKPYLITLINSNEFNEGEELIELVQELSVVNLQSDIPEAIKYYKMEKELCVKLSKPVPEIVEKSIKVLEDYQNKVLIEGKYYKLDW
jgi:tetratricopeptide (TPR) repeat protein